MTGETIIDVEEVPRQRKRWQVMILLILVAGIGGGIWWLTSMPDYSSETDPPVSYKKEEEKPVTVVNNLPERKIAPVETPHFSTTQKEVEALEKKVATLESRIASLEEALEAKPDVSTSATPPDEYTAELETRLNYFASRLQEIESSLPQKEAKRSAVLVDFYLLEREAMAGNPYESEYDTLMRNEDLPPALREKLNALEALSGSGIPTLDVLRQEFAQSLKDYYTNPEKAGADGTWEKVQKNIQGLVTIRKVGESHEGTDSGSILARAESAMNKGDLVVAQQEIEALPKEEAAVFEHWNEIASARTHLLAVIGECREILLEPAEENAPAPEILPEPEGPSAPETNETPDDPYTTTPL